MPAIITKSVTDHIVGQISETDVHRIINDYQNHVTVGYDDGSRSVHKHSYFTLDLDRITDMIKKTKNADKKLVRIYLSLNLPTQETCDNNNNIANFLSVILCCINEKGSTDPELLKANDYVIVEGFSDFSIKQPNYKTPCCVQGTPPPPNP